MIISGLLKTTLLDYPGCVAATVFLGGCNMACPFCHNSSLITEPKEAYSMEEFIDFLARRKNILEGVCISGGEPTIHRDLPEFIQTIKHLGFPVKLDTNGSNPSMLRHLIEEKLIDYVAMDVKSAPEVYEGCCGTSVDMSSISESVTIQLRSKIFSIILRTLLLCPEFFIKYDRTRFFKIFAFPTYMIFPKLSFIR